MSASCANSSGISPGLFSGGGLARQALEDAGQVLGGPWLAEQVTLRLGAAFLAHAAELLSGLDTLGCRRDAKPASEPRNRPHDRDRIRVLAEIADERLIDLDLVERKLAQIAQARIAGAEVVHRDAHAE